MAHTEMVTIERLELRLKDLKKIKQAFNLEDNAEVVRKAVELAAGRIELESIVRKHQGRISIGPGDIETNIERA